MRLVLRILLLMAATLFAAPAHAAVSPPNIVLIFADDLGYGDLACYGSKNPTPNLDRLAAQGARFTDFYAAQAVCSASRAALLTGCYPNRVGILGALGPGAKVGLSSNELTIAELLKGRGYATAIFGKWHLGRASQFLPTRHGFDEFFGLPYSNDMWPRHPLTTNYPPLPLIEGEKVIELMPDQTRLTVRYTERAVQFIERNHARPFFLYVPHHLPHVPLFVSDRHRGKSGRGPHGDAIMEVDWSVGQILDALKAHKLEENTLVVFTSDNGPWLAYGDHAGSAGPLREGKATSFDGGVRVPCLMRWPGKIAPGTVRRDLALTMDLLPTFAKLAGATLPAQRIIDGRDIWPLISGQPDARTPHEAFFIYWGAHLQAVRSGKWTLHFPHTYVHVGAPGGGGKPGKTVSQKVELSLFDIEKDPAQKVNLADKFPEVVSQLQQLADRCREDLGDSATKQKGKNLRDPGRLLADSAN